MVDARSVQRKREMCVVFVILSFSRRKVTVPVMAARRDRLASRPRKKVWRENPFAQKRTRDCNGTGLKRRRNFIAERIL